MNGFFVESVQREVAQEKAQGLALAEQRLLASLDAYRRRPPESTHALHERALWDLVDAVTSFVVQREACGLRDATRIFKLYEVPMEIAARIGIRRRPDRR